MRDLDLTNAIPGQRVSEYIRLGNHYFAYAVYTRDNKVQWFVEDLLTPDYHEPTLPLVVKQADSYEEAIADFITPQVRALRQSRQLD
jgi:hypothetical protein